MKNPKYQIGIKVYHVTPESDCGVVIDACFYMLTEQWHYQVSFSAHAPSLWYYEHELSTTKTF